MEVYLIVWGWNKTHAEHSENNLEIATDKSQAIERYNEVLELPFWKNEECAAYAKIMTIKTGVLYNASFLELPFEIFDDDTDTWTIKSPGIERIERSISSILSGSATTDALANYTDDEEQ